MDEILARDQNQFREPHRRWLRHTYQEGPGFRFLATRGGRPPELDQHRSDAAIVRARARAVRLARDEGIAAALAAGSLSRTTLWRWTCAYERDGLAALVPERRGPRHPALKHPGWVEQVVIAVRLTRTGMPSASRPSCAVARSPMSATAGSANSLTTWAPTDPRGRASEVRATSAPALTRSGTSISRVPSSSSSRAGGI